MPPAARPRRVPRPIAIVAAVLVAAIAVVVLAGYLSIRSQLREASDELAQDRARAEQAVQERARRYAAAVAGEEPDISDQRLDELAVDLDVTVQVIDREAGGPGNLRLVIEAVEPYGGGFTTGVDVAVCYEMAFTSLGTPDAAHQLTALPSCPTVGSAGELEGRAD